MITASSEAQQEEELPAESTPASEPASSQEVREEADSAPASSQEPQEAAAASEPAAPAASESAPAASSEAAAAPAPVVTEPAPAAPAPAQPQQQEVMVWIPTHGGTKYHSRSSCSGMEDPQQVTLEEAQALGFTPCKRCH